jgi:hypothetical protein
MEYFSNEYKNQTKGLILMDSSSSLCEKETLTKLKPSIIVYYIFSLLGKTGILRIFDIFSFFDKQLMGPYDDNLKVYGKRFLTYGQTWNGAYQEMILIEESCKLLNESRANINQVPLYYFASSKDHTQTKNVPIHFYKNTKLEILNNTDHFNLLKKKDKIIESISNLISMID